MTSLPTQHGIEVTMSCPEDYTLSGTDRAVCEDGEFIVDGQTPVCLGKDVVTLNLEIRKGLNYRYRKHD